MERIKKEMITWLASYPKSGNTWLRMMLTAYKQNGHLDINESAFGMSDSMLEYMQAVAAGTPLEKVGELGMALLRPAALFRQITVSQFQPLFMKTHTVNGLIDNVVHTVPPLLTERSIYIVRDPRDVVMSLSRHLDMSVEEAAAAMANPRYALFGTDVVPQFLSSWSNNVRTWVGGDKGYPRLLLRYEDMMEDPTREMRQVLDFCKMDIDEDRLERAVEACRLDKLKRQETDKGFVENREERGDFFHRGGSRWREELDPAIARQIEEDHGEVMEQFGYV